MVARVLDVPRAEIKEIEANETKVSERCYCKNNNCVVCIVIMGEHNHDFAILTSNCFQRSSE